MGAPPCSARLWRQGALFANARAFKIAIFSLLPLLVITAPVRAQAPAAPRATPHEAARPANAQDMFGWLRQFAPTQRRQSRAVSSPPLPRPRPCGTYAHTHRTKPNLGRACASLAGAKPDAYGSCTARRAERGSAERLKDRLATDRARRRAELIKLCTYRHLEGGPEASRGGAQTHQRLSVADGGAFYAVGQSRQKSRNGLGESAV